MAARSNSDWECIKLFALSSLFKLFCTKNIEKHIFTSNWSAQRPNAGQNIQLMNTFISKTNSFDIPFSQSSFISQIQNTLGADQSIMIRAYPK